MPGINPTVPIPGVVTDQGKYPQYGVGGGTPGSPDGWKQVTAHNLTEKNKYLSQGYLIWFATSQDAKSYISSESSAFGSGSGGPFAGLADLASAVAKIGAVFYDIGKALTDGKMWRSLGWLILGLLLALGGAALWLRGSFSPLSMLKQGVKSA